MNFEWTATLTLGAIISLIMVLTIAIHFIWLKKDSPTVKSKSGDARHAQIGPVSGQGSVGVANSGDGAQLNIDVGPKTIINHPPQPKYGETEKRKAKEDIRQAFKGFFWVYFGESDLKGVLNNPYNLDTSNPRMFNRDRQSTIGQNIENGRKQFESRLRTSSPILENVVAEGLLDDLRQQLMSIKDPFNITQELKKEILQKVDSILAGAQAT